MTSCCLLAHVMDSDLTDGCISWVWYIACAFRYSGGMTAPFHIKRATAGMVLVLPISLHCGPCSCTPLQDFLNCSVIECRRDFLRVLQRG